MTSILITRPLGQQENLTRRCEALGLTCMHLPCLSITYLDKQDIGTTLTDATGIVLFTSKHSVISAHRAKPFPWSHVDVHAIGTATAAVLQSYGQTVSLIPPAPHNSEAYVQQLKSRHQQPVLIVKGIGGRTLIYDQLTERGWSVNQLDVYQRTLPSVDQAEIDRIFSVQIPQLISITSSDALTNFLHMSKTYQPALFSSQLIVNSKRCASEAIQRGFEHQPLISSPPGDDGQISCIKRWLEQS